MNIVNWLNNVNDEERREKGRKEKGKREKGHRCEKKREREYQKGKETE